MKSCTILLRSLDVKSSENDTVNESRMRPPTEVQLYDRTKITSAPNCNSVPRERNERRKQEVAQSCIFQPPAGACHTQFRCEGARHAVSHDGDRTAAGAGGARSALLLLAAAGSECKKALRPRSRTALGAVADFRLRRSRGDTCDITSMPTSTQPTPYPASSGRAGSRRLL